MTARLNFIILFASLPILWGCLWLASHSSWWVALVAAWIFSLVNMLPFALMHEAVHGVGATSKKTNYLLGLFGGLVFGTSISMQTVAHLGHHQRNRTDAELYDYYLPYQSKVMRNFWLFAGNLFGLYWFCIPFSNAIFLMSPWIYRSKLFAKKLAPALGFGPYIDDLVRLPIGRVWVEVVLVFIYHIGIFLLIDLTWQGWLICYWLFALHWSALQYVDHAWSARDTINGAWNLKVSKISSLLALNYHYHLTHHQHPNMPWNKLPELAGHARGPSFWSIYFSLWRGVKPAPPMGSPANYSLFSSTYQPR